MPMINDHARGGEGPGERLLLAFFKMTVAVNLYHASNPRLFAVIDIFREAIAAIRAGEGDVSLRIHGGRFYLNRQLVSLTPTAFEQASKLADYFQARSLRGFRFIETEQLWDDQIIAFVELVNRVDREKDPPAFLAAALGGEEFGWIELLVDEEDPDCIVREGEQAAASTSAGGGFAGGAGGGRAGKSRAQLAASAREAYSQALTGLHGMLGKLPSQKRVSMQQTKRVIQNLIDILAENEALLLGLGTIRDFDDYTYTHSVNVAILSMCLGKHLGLTRSAIEQVGLCGLFHDLGKVDLPVQLITKPARLTSDEFEAVKKHPVYSIRQIMRFTADHAMLSRFLLAPFQHHIGIDLSGYPQAAWVEPPCLLSRIISIADQYDALTSTRSYRPKPFSPDVALRIMVGASGTKLDPLLLKVFIDMVGVYPVGSFLKLDTGEFGLVVGVSGQSGSGRPLVVLLHRDGDRLVAGVQADLSERGEGGVGYRRNIVRCFHPSEHGIQPAEFLV